MRPGATTVMRTHRISVRTRIARRALALVGAVTLAALPAVAADRQDAEQGREVGLHQQLATALAAFCEAASASDEAKIRATRSHSSMKFVDDLFAEMGRDIAQAFAQMKTDCEELPDFSGDEVQALQEGKTAGLFVARIPEDVPGHIECVLVRFVDEGEGWRFDAKAVVYSDTLEVDSVRYSDVESQLLEVHRINGLIRPQSPGQ